MSDPFARTEMQFDREEDIDPRVVELSRDYLERLRGGQQPDRQQFIERLPELQEELEEYLEGIELAFSLEAANSTGHQALTSHLNELPGEPIGDFRIVREIGRGGINNKNNNNFISPRGEFIQYFV